MGTVVYHVTMCSITTPSAYWPVCHGKRRKCNGMLSLHGKLFAFTYTPGASRSASRCFHRLGAFRCAPQEVPSRGRGQLRWLFLFSRQWRPTDRPTGRIYHFHFTSTSFHLPPSFFFCQGCGVFRLLLQQALDKRGSRCSRLKR